MSGRNGLGLRASNTAWEAFVGVIIRSGHCMAFGNTKNREIRELHSG